MKEIEEPRVFLLSTSWSLVSVKFKPHTGFIRLYRVFSDIVWFLINSFQVEIILSIEYTFVLVSKSVSSPFIIPCIDGAIFAGINCCWSDREVNLVNVGWVWFWYACVLDDRWKDWWELSDVLLCLSSDTSMSCLFHKSKQTFSNLSSQLLTWFTCCTRWF